MSPNKHHKTTSYSLPTPVSASWSGASRRSPALLAARDEPRPLVRRACPAQTRPAAGPTPAGAAARVRSTAAAHPSALASNQQTCAQQSQNAHALGAAPCSPPRTPCSLLLSSIPRVCRSTTRLQLISSNVRLHAVLCSGAVLVPRRTVRDRRRIWMQELFPRPPPACVRLA